MYKRLWFAFILLLTAMVNIAVAAPLKIGLIYDATQATASSTKEAIRGAELAIAQVNAQGGVLGRQLQLAATQINVANLTVQPQLPLGDTINIVIGLGNTSFVQDTAPLVLAKQKLFIAVGATGDQLLQQFTQNFFVTNFNNNIEGAAVAQYIFDQLHFSHALVINQQTTDASELSQAFIATYQHLTGTVIDHITISDVKFTPEQLQSIVDAKPEVIFLVGSTKTIPTLIKQLRTNKIRVPIMGSDNYERAQLTDLGENIADNIYFTTHGNFDNNFIEPPMEKFVAAYAKKYAAAPQDIYSALGYDAVNLIVTTIRKANSTDPAALNLLLKKTTAYPAITGELNLTNDVPRNIVTMKKILDAKVRIAAMVIPQYLPE